ncbi:hypothetical protein BU080_11145 [Staphylococcus warneri]|nr:hypothetical protein BU080_11145 [Staphylococcus warneri]
MAFKKINNVGRDIAKITNGIINNGISEKPPSMKYPNMANAGNTNAIKISRDKHPPHPLFTSTTIPELHLGQRLHFIFFTPFTSIYSIMLNLL